VGLREMEQEYLEVVAKKWRTLRAGDAEIPLTEVFAMLETTERPRRTPLQESPELALLPERFEHAGLPDSTAVGDIPKRMSLPEALREAIHMVLLGEPGAGKSTTLQFVGLSSFLVPVPSWKGPWRKGWPNTCGTRITPGNC